MQSLRAVWIALPLSLFAACGGQSEKDDDGTGGSAGTAAGAKGGDAGTSGTKGGSSGSSTGGSAGTSGKGGTAGVGGADGGAFAGGASGFGGTGVGADGGTSGTAGDAGTAGVGGMACCKAAAVCPEGATTYAPGAKCPPDNTCEELTVCCNTILCATPTATCNAFPSCDEGDSQVDGCAPDESCYSRTLCGNTILCADLTCDPAAEYNRKYVTTGSGCNEIDYECPDQTTPFFNACGCGCEQDSSCPMSDDCSPGPEPKPSCDNELLAKCPYTLRAL